MAEKSNQRSTNGKTEPSEAQCRVKSVADGIDEKKVESKLEELPELLKPNKSSLSLDVRK